MKGKTKILHITTKSKGGAGIAALRLHQALQENGISSAYLSTDLTIDFDGNIFEETFFKYQRPSLVKKLILKIQLFLFPTSFQKAKKQLKEIDEKLHYEMISFPFSNFKLEQHKLVQEADLINLHWVSGILDYSTFLRKSINP